MSARRTIARGIVALVAACALAACGGSGGNGDGGGAGGGGGSTRLVDPTKDPPFVNALDIDPADGRFLLTTNRGFFKIDPKTKEVETVRGTVTGEPGSSPVGTFLELVSIGPGKMLGSGHPDNERPLPQYLGLTRSDDGGRTWQVLSRLGEADLHKIVVLHDRLYAFDAVLSAIIISDDGGRTFTERFTPQGLVIDFVVDPKDPDHLVAATEEQLYRSQDGGEKWRAVDSARGTRLAWAPGGPILRANEDGTVMRSSDGGRSFEPIGEVDGEPYKFKSIDAQHHYLALADGTIVETKDGGVTWTTAFAP